jgi:hypothetical protein
MGKRITGRTSLDSSTSLGRAFARDERETLARVETHAASEATHD